MPDGRRELGQVDIVARDDVFRYVAGRNSVWWEVLGVGFPLRQLFTQRLNRVSNDVRNGKTESKIKSPDI